MMVSTEQNKPRTERVFRPEIQGLRALGSILVAVYHIWVERVSGGVDVFFVISGFLILGALINESANSGKVDLVRFGRNLAIRLLPLAFLVIVIVLVAAPFILPATRWHTVLIDSIASGAYLENWRLAFWAVDYLDRSEALSPFQHYWAMSVQTQFYILFGPLLFVLCLFLPKEHGRRFRIVIGVNVVIIVASLSYSIWSTNDRQVFAYFDTFARVWEFSLGGLLAAAMPYIRASSSVRLLLGWAGFVLILSCGIALDVSRLFPGYLALWPTLGAAMVIFAGQTGSSVGVDRFLSAPFFTYLGKISYALYLWHWPILVVYLAQTGSAHAGLVGGLGIFALSLLLAAGSTWLVEDALKIDRKHGILRAFGWISAQAAIIAVLVSAGLFMERRQRTADRGVALPSPQHPGGSVPAGTRTTSAALIPHAWWASKDRPRNMTGKCHQSLTGQEPITCTFGPEDAPNTLAIVGGSHSAHWFTAVSEALKGKPWKIVTYTKSSCLFLKQAPSRDSQFSESCSAWNADLMTILRTNPPTAVFTTSTRSFNGPEAIPAFWSETMNSLGAAGIPVIAIRDTPWMMFNVTECVARNGSDAEECRRPRSKMLAASSPLERATSPQNVRHIDLTDRFCDEKWCYPVVGNVLVYFDEHHMTESFGRSLGPAMASHLLPILSEIELAKPTGSPGTKKP